MTVAYSVRRRLLDAELARVVTRAAGTVIEIGAGRAGRRGRFVPAVEPSGRLWTIDLRAVVAPHLVADITALPLRDGAVDQVLMLEVLEYVSDPAAALREIHRVLRPGGHAVVSVPFLHRVDSATDRWRFSEHGLRRMLEAAGFDVASVHRQGALFASIAHLVGSVVAQRRYRLERWLLGAIASPLLVLAWLEPRFIRADSALTTATTGYLALARR